MDVTSLPIEFDKKKIDSRYRFVIAAIKRAKELYNGAMPKIATTKAEKITTSAIEDVLSGSVRVLTDETAVKAKEESEKLTYEDMMDEAKQKVSFPEKLTELEKDLKVYLYKKKEMDSQETTEEISRKKAPILNSA